ncbi:MAG TPA: PAS domain S-box protein [Jatrophihabitans sp.]|nr:PAS domain S-box protein [Jatrophihabitans sp.]
MATVPRLVVAGVQAVPEPVALRPASTEWVAVIGTDFSGKVTLWAAKAQSMFGWTRAEAVGRRISELVDLGLTAQDFVEFVFVGSHGAFSRDLAVTNRFGARLALRMTATLATDPSGEDEIIATFQPIEPGQPALREGDRAPRLIADRGSDLVLICDRNMAITYAGPSPSYTCGHRVREIMGSTVWQFVHPADVPRLRREWQRVLAVPGSNLELELRARDADGGWRWARLRLSNLLADESISAVVVNITDVTEERRVRQRLESSSRMLAEFMDCALEGVWVIDPAGRTVIANARMAELLGVEHARLLEGSVFDFIDPEAAEFIRHRLNHRATGAREQYECSLVRRDGARRWFQVSASPRYSKSGKYLGSIGMCHDITDRKLLERELGRREPGAVTGARPADDTPVPGLDRLSRREDEVVRMLLRGDRVPVIARQLFVSQSTVRNHLSSVFRKLRVTSQQELIVLLRERHLAG